MDYQSRPRTRRGGRNSSKQLYSTINLQDLRLLILYLNESQRHNVWTKRPSHLPSFNYARWNTLSALLLGIASINRDRLTSGGSPFLYMVFR